MVVDSLFSNSSPSISVRNMDRYVSEKLKLKGSVFSLDVECVAVGKTHMSNDRAPAKFALVDSWGKTVCVQYIRPIRRGL